jgi:hypothetical protein
MSTALKRSIGLAGALGLLAAGAGHASTSGAGQGPAAANAARTAPPPAEQLPPGSGKVVLTCQVLSDRTVGQCQVADEAPLGHGLGEAALRMTREIRIPRDTFKPEMVGAEVDIPLSFSLDADAGDMPTGGGH